MTGLAAIPPDGRCIVNSDTERRELGSVCANWLALTNYEFLEKSKEGNGDLQSRLEANGSS